AKRTAEAFDDRGGGHPDTGEDGISRVFDVLPGAAGCGGYSLEGTCGLALLRLQDAHMSASVLAQLANPPARIGLDLLLRFAQAPLDLVDRLFQVLDPLLNGGVRDPRLTGHCLLRSLGSDLRFETLLWCFGGHCPLLSTALEPQHGHR